MASAALPDGFEIALDNCAMRVNFVATGIAMGRIEMSNISPAGESYNIGRVLSRMFAIIKSRFGTLAGFLMVALLALFVIMGISMIPLMAAIGGMAASSGINSPPNPLMMMTSPGMISGIIFLYVMILLWASFVFAGGIFGCLRYIPPNVASFSDCFGAGFRKMLPTLGLQLLMLLCFIPVGIVFSVLMALAVKIGPVGYFLAFVVYLGGAVTVGVVFSTAIPAMINENIGVFASLSRSWTLIKGSKRWILLTYLIFGVAIFLLLAILFAIVGGVMGVSMLGAGNGGSPAAFAGAAFSGILVMLVLEVLFMLIVYIAMFAIQASIYHEVRLVTEGGSSGDLRDIFA
jgi:hypothetical protein